MIDVMQCNYLIVVNVELWSFVLPLPLSQNIHYPFLTHSAASAPQKIYYNSTIISFGIYRRKIANWLWSRMECSKQETQKTKISVNWLVFHKGWCSTWRRKSCTSLYLMLTKNFTLTNIALIFWKKNGTAKIGVFLF